MDLDLNALGRAYLDVVDYRVSSLAIGAILGAISLHRRYQRKRWLPLADILRAALGMLMISSALTIFCVFLLTKPPYLEALSGDSLSTTAFITCIFMFGFGAGEVRRLYRDRKKP
jgi:membrane associated rhomboid family serine protease